MRTHGRELVRWAREKLRESLGGPKAERPTGAWTDEPGASFVTLRWKSGGLQGCIGSLEPERSIIEDVAHNAIAAGTRDPRTRPCTLADIDSLHVELSILSALEPIESEAAIRPGVDGIVLVHEFRRATFLPVMWTRLPEVGTFMAELRHKAGLPPGFAGQVQLMRYTVDHFEDRAP